VRVATDPPEDGAALTARLLTAPSLSVELARRGVTVEVGVLAEAVLGQAHMTINKNAIPNDPESPFVTSGIRVGSAAMTTRGFSEDEAYTVGRLIAETIFRRDEPTRLDQIRAEVKALLEAHPLYPEL
jgi:glycine/serine hydroxymethyltransferase